MSSDSDSSEDDERMKKLRESVVPISCLPGNGKVSQTTSSTPVETCAGSSKVAGQSRHAQSLKPSIRRKVYGDDGSENQSGLNLDAGAKERIARTLQKSLQSELVEERKFTITQNHEDEVDTAGVRLFKKSPLVCSDGEKKVVEPAKKSNSRKKRTLSSSDSDSDDRAKMIDLVSVAVSADTIRMNSLTNNVTTSTNTDDVSEPVSQTGELDHSNTDSGPTSKKKKKKKKRKSEVTEVVSEVT